MVVCSLKCYSRKVWYKYRCSLLNSLDPISCKGFVCIPYVISVMISRELKYIDCTFPRVILIPDSTNFLLIVFKVFRKTRLLKLPKRRKPLTHFPKKPKLSVCELQLFLSEYACTISLKETINFKLCFQHPTFKSHFAYLFFLLHVISKSIVNVVYRLAKRNPCSQGISGKIPADFPKARISTKRF